MKTGILLLFLFLLNQENALLAQQLPALIPYRHWNKWGYCDSTRKIIVKPVYSEVTLLSHGYGEVVKGGLFHLRGKHGRVDSTGKITFPDKYDEIIPAGFIHPALVDFSKKGYYEKGYAVVRKGKHYGVIDSIGNICIPILYPRLNFYSNGLYLASKEDYDRHSSCFTLISCSNKIIIPWTPGSVREYF